MHIVALAGQMRFDLRRTRTRAKAHDYVPDLRCKPGFRAPS